MRIPVLTVLTDAAGVPSDEPSTFILGSISNTQRESLSFLLRICLVILILGGKYI